MLRLKRTWGGAATEYCEHAHARGGEAEKRAQRIAQQARTTLTLSAKRTSTSRCSVFSTARALHAISREATRGRSAYRAGRAPA
jgi:hypothetical protein